MRTPSASRHVFNTPPSSYRLYHLDDTDKIPEDDYAAIQDRINGAVGTDTNSGVRKTQSAQSPQALLSHRQHSRPRGVFGQLLFSVFALVWIVSAAFARIFSEGEGTIAVDLIPQQINNRLFISVKIVTAAIAACVFLSASANRARCCQTKIGTPANQGQLEVLQNEGKINPIPLLRLGGFAGIFDRR